MTVLRRIARHEPMSFWSCRPVQSVRFFALCLFVLWCLPAAVQAADRPAFPVDIPNAFGVTHVEAEPQRVVSISYIGHDFLLALGVKPYALRKWYGNDPFGVWPWAQAALGDAQPIVLQGEINIEAIAALKPDLIDAQWSGMTKAEYALLSRIAPTLAPPPGESTYSTPWQAMLRASARATGRAERAEEIIAGLEHRMAEIRARHPEWQGKTVAMAWPGQVGAFGARDIRSLLMGELGLSSPPALRRYSDSQQFLAYLPDEDLSPIDADALIWFDTGGGTAFIAALPLRRTLRAYREGREIVADPLLSAAMSHSSPLSLGYVLDHIEPLLEQALDGDPATPVEGMEELAPPAKAFDKDNS
jgi:iron complex transport system substrate-binding protein